MVEKEGFDQMGIDAGDSQYAGVGWVWWSK